MPNKKINGCIHILSGRVKCLKYSLESFYQYYNYKYDYPVYVYYFDPLYSDEYIKDIHLNINSNIEFIELDYSLPKHIDRSELFLYRNNEYVRTSFGVHRIGYLHMINYFVNFYNYPQTKFKDYNYCLSFDDDTIFLKEIELDIFRILKENNSLMGSLNVTKRALPANQRTLDTREKQFEFVQYYIQKYKFEQNTIEFNSILDIETFYGYSVTDTNVYDMTLFKTKEWNQWITEINNFGGIYKYRWGDHELNGLFWIIHFNKPFYNFNLVNQGYLDPGGLRHIQDYTPGVKNWWK